MNDLVRSPRVRIHSEPDFEITYDIFTLGEGQFMYFVHMDVHRFNREVLRNIKRAVDKHRPSLPNIIFCQPANDSPLFEKFVARFGFKFIKDCWCEDGLNRRIFVNYRIPFDGQ